MEIKSGWLFKKAESSWGWRKRWFVLYKSRLAYFSSPDARGVVKTIALNDPRVETVVEALPHELEFRINRCVRQFLLPTCRKVFVCKYILLSNRCVYVEREDKLAPPHCWFVCANPRTKVMTV